jgi:hypothetical protein
MNGLGLRAQGSRRLGACALAVLIVCGAAVVAQTPLGKEAADLRAHFARQTLDRYLETWNSRDAERWATSLHFPPAQYVASVNFAQTLATGWHHSEWPTRRVLQIGTVVAYFRAWNSHDPKALGAAMHFPHVRIGDGAVEVWPTAAEFLAGPEPGRQRTWFETRLDHVEVAQTSASGVNVAVTYSRRDRAGQALSSYEAVFLVVRRDDRWRVQATSTLGI